MCVFLEGTPKLAAENHHITLPETTVASDCVWLQEKPRKCSELNCPHSPLTFFFFTEYFEICVFSAPRAAMAKTLNSTRTRHHKSKIGVSVAP